MEFTVELLSFPPHCKNFEKPSRFDEVLVKIQQAQLNSKQRVANSFISDGLKKTYNVALMENHAGNTVDGT